MNQVTGKVLRVLDTKTTGANAFKSRSIHVKTDEQYPQTLDIQFNQEKSSLLDNYKEGDNVKIDINLRGREWVNEKGETSVFNSIAGWKIEKTA
jgi:translation initiation factor IF-3